ncbi:MAG TPA: type 1 glutamine amidotransferase domain-containing protein [Opitutaceae bacterium]
MSYVTAPGVDSSSALRLSQSTAATPLVPSLNTNLLLAHDAPANHELRRFVEEPPADSTALSGKRVAILATDGVEEVELTVPYARFKAEGASVHLISPRAQDLPAFGVYAPASRQTHILTIRLIETAGWFPIDRFLDQVKGSDYDAVIIPGGAWNPDMLRANPQALDFVRQAASASRIVAALCHGPQVLISAGLVKGRRATSWWSMMTDLVNAGASVEDVPVIVDGLLITSRSPLDIPHFYGAVREALLAAKTRA